MKNLYFEAKQQLSSCVLQDNTDCTDCTDAASLSPASSEGLTGEHLPSHKLHYDYNYDRPSTQHQGNNHNKNNKNNNNNNSGNTTQCTNNPHFATTCTYDTMQRPFKADKRRGRWSMTFDFYAACTSHAFGSIVFSEVPVYALLLGGVYFLPAFLIAIILYAIPMFIIQTFLGQFSSSGTISAFRVAPIFKGIGYSILILNMASLSYYGVIAAMPLIYAVSSLHPVIPWMSCDNKWNTPNCSTHSTYDVEDDFLYPHATVEFFRYIIQTSETSSDTFAISWPILFATMSIWLLSLGILLKRVTFIGKLFRWMFLFMISFFTTVFVYQLLHVNFSWKLLLTYFEPMVSTQSVLNSTIPAAFLIATWLLGPGWGSTLTLASHNHFRRDSERLTYWISGTYIVLVLMALLCGRIVLDHFEDHVGLFHYHVEEEHFMQFLYLCFAYYFGSISSLPNFLSFLFFFMLFIAELSAVIVQMMSVLTALFDEYESLRHHKAKLTISFVFLMMCTSVYFSTNFGFAHLNVLPNVALLTHIIISFVLLVMTTWIYGRERFQCDLQFMLGKTISSFKIFLIRFVTPVILILSCFPIIHILSDTKAPTELNIAFQFVVYFVAPSYMIYKVCQTTGTLRDRLRQCFKPHDWHPVDTDNRRFYDELMGTSEMLVIDNEQAYANSP